MTTDQLPALFDAGEAFIENTIAAALVILWLVALGLHLARPYMAHTTGKFTLRLGADLWWIIYIGLRDVFLLQVFLGSFIFFYPDVIKAQPMPITGSLAAVLAFAALLIKLMTKNDADLRWFRVQVLLVAAGATLYIGAYFFGVQATELTGQHITQLVPSLVTNTNLDVALPLCYLMAAVAGILGVVAVAYNFRLSSVRKPKPSTED
jgi:hypothetical protein